MRRDIAMLGLLYKVSRGGAPKQIQKLFSLQPYNLGNFGLAPFVLRHRFQIHDPVEVSHPVIIRRSFFGLIRVFNQLRPDFVESKNVQIFQRSLQKLAVSAAKTEKEGWQLMFHASL